MGQRLGSRQSTGAKMALQMVFQNDSQLFSQASEDLGASFSTDPISDGQNDYFGFTSARAEKRGGRKPTWGPLEGSASDASGQAPSPAQEQLYKRSHRETSPRKKRSSSECDSNDQGNCCTELSLGKIRLGKEMGCLA